MVVSSSAYTPTIIAQIRYLLQWFSEWSEMERGDFLPVLVHEFMVKSGTVNGLLPIVDGQYKEDRRPLSLFKCRIKLFTEWVQTWSDDDKESFLSGIRSMDVNFAERYEQKVSVNADNNFEYVNGVNGENDEKFTDEVV